MSLMVFRSFLLSLVRSLGFLCALVVSGGALCSVSRRLSSSLALSLGISWSVATSCGLTCRLAVYFDPSSPLAASRSQSRSEYAPRQKLNRYGCTRAQATRPLRRCGRVSFGEWLPSVEKPTATKSGRARPRLPSRELRSFRNFRPKEEGAAFPRDARPSKSPRARRRWA